MRMADVVAFTILLQRTYAILEQSDLGRTPWAPPHSTSLLLNFGPTQVGPGQHPLIEGCQKKLV